MNAQAPNDATRRALAVFQEIISTPQGRHAFAASARDAFASQGFDEVDAVDPSVLRAMQGFSPGELAVLADLDVRFQEAGFQHVDEATGATYFYL